jgi:hypothetical protein
MSCPLLRAKIIKVRRARALLLLQCRASTQAVVYPATCRAFSRCTLSTGVRASRQQIELCASYAALLGYMPLRLQALWHQQAPQRPSFERALTMLKDYRTELGG